MSVSLSIEGQVACLRGVIAGDQAAIKMRNDKLARLYREYQSTKQEIEELEMHVHQNLLRLRQMERS